MNGFTARVYSYRSLKIPPGAVLCDAATVLPARELRRYTQGGSPENLAAFSDAFRYRLLRSQGGWWFDTDVICLAPVEQFVSPCRSKAAAILAGWEDHQQQTERFFMSMMKHSDALLQMIWNALATSSAVRPVRSL
ncbi:capsular polysaccharide synthesis protein [Candidatus Skiveiella danica]|uniref:capsular polysaccharide synthesis protein n=1 Tax=Candidatus Skiveiella danica TaxID=3386177 RepID=UPI001D39863D|nr:hypothetical protein [Betaproteobacteria bacterium]